MMECRLSPTIFAEGTNVLSSNSQVVSSVCGSGVRLVLLPSLSSIVAGRKPLPCSPLCSSRKRARSCLEKLSKNTRINSLKPASLEAFSEIISDLCSTVSFIVLVLISYFTTNIRTLELTHVYRAVSSLLVSSFSALSAAVRLFVRLLL